MHYIVTGGLGFIGSHLTAKLISLGHEVMVIDNLRTGKVSPASVLPRKAAHRMDASMLLKNPHVLKDCAGVFHLAADVSVVRSMEEPYETTEHTFMEGVAVFQAAAKAGVRVVFPSSAAVYGMTEGRCHVSSPSHPASPYGVAKLALENMAATIPNLSYSALRLFNVYGYGQDAASPYSGVVSKFVDTALKGEASMIYGDGEQVRDFIHVDDVVRYMVAAMSGAAPRVFNVGTGNPVSVNALHRLVYDAANNPAKALYAPARVGEIKSSYAAVHATQYALGVNPEVSLECGVVALIDKLRESATL